jgi:hypothetical protein
MKKIIYLILLVWVDTYGAKSLGTHVHGSVGLDMAVEKNQILVLLKGPTESFLGFEYRPKTSEEKNKFQKLKHDFGPGLKKLLGVDNCDIKNNTFKQLFKGKNHSEIQIETYFNCESPLRGKKIAIKLKKYYPGMESIHLQLIREDGTVVNQKVKSQIFHLKL